MKPSYLISLIGLFALISCEKPNADDPDITKLYGNYELSNINWHGTSVDLNNDGTGYWNLLYEFQNKLGYYEPDYTAVVQPGIVYSHTEPYSNYSTSFNVTIPYPHYTMVDGKWKCLEIKSLKTTIRATDNSIRLHVNCCHIFPGFNDPDDPFLSSIQDVSLVVDSYDDNKFKIGVHCTLPFDFNEEQTLNENYLYYGFIKE